MKKVLTFVVVLVAATLVSCGGNTQKTAEAAEVETTVEETVCCEQADSCCAAQADTTAVVEVATEEVVAE